MKPRSFLFVILSQIPGRMDRDASLSMKTKKSISIPPGGKRPAKATHGMQTKGQTYRKSERKSMAISYRPRGVQKYFPLPTRYHNDGGNLCQYLDLCAQSAIYRLAKEV